MNTRSYQTNVLEMDRGANYSSRFTSRWRLIRTHNKEGEKTMLFSTRSSFPIISADAIIKLQH